MALSAMKPLIYLFEPRLGVLWRKLERAFSAVVFEST
jgi:hypothetical protein